MDDERRTKDDPFDEIARTFGDLTPDKFDDLDNFTDLKASPKPKTRTERNDELEKLYSELDKLRDQKKHDKIIECCDKIIALKTPYQLNYGLDEREKQIDDAYEWHVKGYSLAFGLGRREEALECYDKAIEIDPKDAATLFNKGLVLGRLDRHEEAVECYDKALEIDPKDVATLYWKGRALGRLGRHKEAVECYDKAVEIDPKDVDVLNQ